MNPLTNRVQADMNPPQAIKGMHILLPSFNLPQQDRLSIDVNTEQRVGFTTQVSSFEVLILLAFAPPYIHKLQLMFHLDREYYNELKQKEHPINRDKPYEEIIGRRHVTYRLSSNGTVEVVIATTDTPFRIEKDEDVSAIFSFLGQVRDRFLYHVSDIRERHVPPLLNWILKQCELNKDIKISDKAQIILPDIELKQADRVFRPCVKIIEGEAYWRGEESLTTVDKPSYSTNM